VIMRLTGERAAPARGGEWPRGEWTPPETLS
jgi:hypothetical protein